MLKSVYLFVDALILINILQIYCILYNKERKENGSSVEAHKITA